MFRLTATKVSMQEAAVSLVLWGSVPSNKASELVPSSLFPDWNSMWFSWGISLHFCIIHCLLREKRFTTLLPAEFKHVTNIVICTLPCCDWFTLVPALRNFKKADFESYYASKILHHFFFSQTWGPRLKYLPLGSTYMLMYSALHIMQWFSHSLDVFSPKIRQNFVDFIIFMNQNKSGLLDLKTKWLLEQRSALQALFSTASNWFVTLYCK